MKFIKTIKRIYQSSKYVHKAGQKVNQARKQVNTFGKQIYMELDDHIDFDATKEELKQEMKDIANEQSVDKIIGWIIIFCAIAYFVL
tara:strand:- start:9040 stop:9300 length:261 start_codon:yes stop_codon:yes gene_type:complete